MARRRVGPVSSQEERKIRAIVRKHARAHGIKEFALEFGEDSEGEPAVRIFFKIKDDYNPSPKWISELSALHTAVSRDVLREGFEHYPFVRFVERLPANQA